MSSKREFEFAEVIVGKLLIESFPNERSAYHDQDQDQDQTVKSFIEKFHGKLKWHIEHSLSPRQKEVIKHYLNGEKEREIAEALGITQQVVNIYKHRAIKKLQRLLTA
jgi:RNA polymerase sigma factor (sigma-70 family)